MQNNYPVKVIFICLGNICRSPTAEGVFSKTVNNAGLSDRILIDSAGTGSWHIGHPPDARAIDAAALRNIDLTGLRARKVTPQDIVEFDYIIAMDNQNLSDLRRLNDTSHHHKINLFLSYAEQYSEIEVPDPYYGGALGFEKVLDMIEDASQGLLATIQRDYG